MRGYILTGDTRHLGPYRSARRGIDRDAHVLQELTAEGVVRFAALPRLDSAVARKLAELEQIVGVRERDGFDAALHLMQSDDVRTSTNAVRWLVRGLEVEGLQAAEQAVAEERSAVSSATMLAGAVVVCSLLLALLSLRAARASRTGASPPPLKVGMAVVA